MKKEAIRKEFFVLKNEGFSYSQCKRVLRAKFEYDVSVRTLKRWCQRFDGGGWDLCDSSRRPHTVHRKLTPLIEQEVVDLRKKTGWGSNKLATHLSHLDISARLMDKILNKHNLCKASKSKGKQKKWIRWQRLHPNSLWQIDHTDEQDLFNCYTLSIIDDCSRYSLALIKLHNVTTPAIIQILEELTKTHGKPREILTDNGGAYGLNSKHSRFDRWCKKKEIKHIRTKIHSPTTNGKVERGIRNVAEEFIYPLKKFPEWLNGQIKQYQTWHNNKRYHKGINTAPVVLFIQKFYLTFLNALSYHLKNNHNN